MANGDAAKAELATLDQLGVAAYLKDIPLIIKIRTMRLELFVLTGQKTKARDEYNELQKIRQCSEARLAVIREITGYTPEEFEKSDRSDLPLLDEIEIYFIVDNIREKNTGILNSVLRKVTLFEEEWAYRPTLVVSEYAKDFRFYNKSPHLL